MPTHSNTDYRDISQAQLPKNAPGIVVGQFPSALVEYVMESFKPEAKAGIVFPFDAAPDDSACSNDIDEGTGGPVAARRLPVLCVRYATCRIDERTIERHATAEAHRIQTIQHTVEYTT